MLNLYCNHFHTVWYSAGNYSDYLYFPKTITQYVKRYLAHSNLSFNKAINHHNCCCSLNGKFWIILGKLIFISSWLKCKECVNGRCILCVTVNVYVGMCGVGMCVGMSRQGVRFNIIHEEANILNYSWTEYFHFYLSDHFF